MIQVICIKDGLPISVIIPLQEKRKDFFLQFVLPLIKANRPSEIIINSDDGGAAKKRNDGFRKSTQPFVLFCDDDILLPKDYLSTLYVAIKDDVCGYVYTGYSGIVLSPSTNNKKTNFEMATVEFDPNLLKKQNFISTMSLIRRDAFPYFDETLPRFHDYDLYLNMLSKGIEGKAIQDTKFYAFYMDDGITSINNPFDHSYILAKYNLANIP